GPFKEGDNVTLKCTADGNPPPSSYSFYINVSLLCNSLCSPFLHHHSGNDLDCC
ncbi:hypothetical protein M9458_030105, partial [Cirrhinus mrigala]